MNYIMFFHDGNLVSEMFDASINPRVGEHLRVQNNGEERTFVISHVTYVEINGRNVLIEVEVVPRFSEDCPTCGE